VPQQNNRSSWKHVCDIFEKKMMKRKQRDSDPSENGIKKGLVPFGQKGLRKNKSLRDRKTKKVP
jgi:hypothetical protein